VRLVHFALALVTVGGFVVAAQAEPPGKVRASVATKGDIWVGQRVTLVMELLTSGFFATAPAFDLPQVAGVIILPPQDRPVVGSETIDGTSYTTQRHELTVFAQRAGLVHIPDFPVRFESTPAFGKPAVEQRVTTPTVTFTAKLPPGAEDLSSVITTRELTVKEAWEPQPGNGPVKLGAAFTRTITVEARDIPGMMIPAFRFDTPEGFGAYPKSPAVADRTERGELIGRRVEIADFVCEKCGTFALPALVLSWWDPKDQKMKRAELPGRTFEVMAPPAALSTAPSPKDLRWLWDSVIVTLTGLLALGVVVWRLTPAIWAWWKRTRKAVAESESAYFTAFERACGTADAQVTYQALLAWLGRFVSEDNIPRTSTLASLGDDPALTKELSILEDDLYGREKTRRRWSPAELLRHVRSARSRIRVTKLTEPKGEESLPPLNPRP
jgi:hypothetical protein